MKSDVITRDRSSELREHRKTCLRAVHRNERLGIGEWEFNSRQRILEDRPVESGTSDAQVAAKCRTRILCADDDPALRACFAKLLTRAGYSVTTVADGWQAWETLQSDPYDLLITDHNMPGLSGLELAGKARCAGLTLPIIVATSDVSSFTDPHTQWLNIAALLQKPFGLRELSDTVGQTLCATHHVRWGHDEGAGFGCVVCLPQLDGVSG